MPLIQFTYNHLMAMKMIMEREVSGGDRMIGYDLCKKLGKSPGVIYPILRKLDDQGYIEGIMIPSIPPRRFYNSTAKGRRVFLPLFESLRLSDPVLKVQKDLDIPDRHSFSGLEKNDV